MSDATLKEYREYIESLQQLISNYPSLADLHTYLCYILTDIS
jgi:hypothetical protein